jgi:hypothetical protein
MKTSRIQDLYEATIDLCLIIGACALVGLFIGIAIKFGVL